MNLTSPDSVANALKAAQKDGEKFPSAPLWLLGEAAQEIADSIARPVPPTSQEVRRAVAKLNAQCLFELTRLVAQAWLDVRGFDATIQKRLVQALVNSTRLDEAERIANDGVHRCEALAPDANAAQELSEFRGLLGRIAKQRYVDSGERSALIAATDQYLAEYDRAPAQNYWHGINALACLTLEQGASSPRAGTPSPDELAGNIFATVKQLDQDRPYSWLAATASEASLALKQCDDAELWLHRFLMREDTTPFNVDSYARQLREIWRGDPVSGSNCASHLSRIIARYIAGTQSRIAIAPAQVDSIKAALQNNAAALEKNFLGESSFTVDSIRSLLKAFESIGCVKNERGERLGTGFLVRGSWLKASFGDGPVFVTNAHVISDSVTKAIRRGSARVAFELDTPVADRPSDYAVKEILFTSDPGQVGVPIAEDDNLDCTIVALEGLSQGAPVLRVTSDLPLIRPLTKAFVAGHPRGGGLQIALHDSLLLDIDDRQRLMHYRTPTDPGSSGSPVFNADWEVMALHHAGTAATPRLHGNGAYEANEGISIAAIRRKLNS
jgi:hypothetical protein